MLKLITVIATLLATLAGPAQAADTVSNGHYYSNQTPYGDPATSQVVAPPAGYEPFFLETVGRHGARSLTDPSAEKRALSVWNAARRKGALTTRGKAFATDLKAFQAAEKKVGYGDLSTVGKAEWSGIGRRTATAYAGFFGQVAATGDAIAFRTTSVYRTKQSATALRGSLAAAFPTLNLTPRTTDNSMLISSGASKSGNAAIAKFKKKSSVRTAARHVLRRLYSASYVASLKDPVAKAMDVYLLYCTAPGMAGDTPVTFAQYVGLKDAKVLATVKDAENFYRYGPGVKGETSSYKQARPVLKDFFAQLDKRVAGGSTAAVFRLAHGETTMPFAALIKLKGSTKQATKSKPYSYSRNSWRGYVAGRLAGNIEWMTYRSASGALLVTMRYNEQPVQFTSACTPISASKYFYRISTLKKCLG